MYSLVRSATLSRYAGLARSVGLDPYRMLASVGLPRSCLDEADRLISASAVCRLLEASAAQSGTDDFGLRLGQNRRLAILGPLSLVIREQPTLREALNSMVRYMSLHSEALQLEIEDKGGAVVIRESLMVEHLGPTRQADEMVLGSLFRMLQELAGPAWKARRVCFSHDAPRSLANHRRSFGCAVEFGCDFNAIVCASKDLEAIPPAANPELARYAREYVESMLAQTNQTMTDKVRRLVHSLLSTGHCSADLVASQLGVDRRTVHRKLAREGASFSGLFDEVRSGLAVHYLARQDRPVSQVAELLGFSMHSAFARWFRDRFGCSATAWRAGHARPDQAAPQTPMATPPAAPRRPA
jgi:AraC-like DNA-binding protein